MLYYGCLKKRKTVNLSNTYQFNINSKLFFTMIINFKEKEIMCQKCNEGKYQFDVMFPNKASKIRYVPCCSFTILYVCQV